MKKFTKLLLLTLLLVCGSQWAKAQKVGMFIGYDNIDAIEDDDEKAAAEWFNTNYVAKGSGVFFTPSTISSLNINEVKALWVDIDRKEIEKGWKNLPHAFVGNETITLLQTYVKNGGNLMLTTYATQLIVALGRIDEKFAPGSIIFSTDGTDAPSQGTDIWTANAVIGSSQNPSYDHRNHAIFQELTVLPADDPIDKYDHESYPLVGQVMRTNHNCMWDLNAYDLPKLMPDAGNVVNAFQELTKSTVLATWGHVTDYCCAGIVEFYPHDDYKGTILCNGLAAYQWGTEKNPYQSNIEKLTSNSLDYLKTLGNTKASITAPITVDGTESYWGTFYSSSAKTLPKGVTAYAVETADNGYAKMVKVAEAGQVIPANQGFLLSSATKQDELYLTTADASAAVPVGSNLLKGSDSEKTFANEGTYYVLGRTGTEGSYTYGLYWQKGTEGKSVKNAANKAYLLIPAASEAKSFTLTFGETTGIDQVVTSAESEKAETYNVAGQRVDAGYKGLVIKNGKKYILK